MFLYECILVYIKLQQYHHLIPSLHHITATVGLLIKGRDIKMKVIMIYFDFLLF